MKLIARLLFLFLLVGMQVQAQEADWKAVSKSVLNFANSSDDPWIKRYEALQQKETTWFNRDTFTMTWRMEPSNLEVKATGDARVPWQVHFNPTFAGNVDHPVWHTYQLSSCFSKIDKGLFLQDFDLVFLLDSTYQVKKVRPDMVVLQEGRSRKFSGREVTNLLWEECMHIAFQGEEAKKSYLVGQRWRKTSKFIVEVGTRKAEIEAALTEAIKAKYTTAEVKEVLSCPESVMECFDFPDPLSEYCRAEGLFTAKSGPKELFYSALIYISEEGVISVEVENIWK